MNKLKKLICILLVLCVMLSLAIIPINALNDTDRFLSIANDIVKWKKSDNGSTDDFLINSTFLEQAGTTAGDWYPIGLGRLGIDDNYDGYLAVLKDQVEERYRQQGKLSAAKATEWHRISLAILASGGNPTSFGKDESGQAINLIADGTYNRGNVTPLGRQGINGWIWGLIALDSMRYEIPKDAYYSRDDIICEILSQQLTDGGFALSGDAADPDITAMAVQALSPYYNSERIYTYIQKSDSAKTSKTVRQVVNEAISCLSEIQLDTGDYESWGTQNVESTCQVVVALCCLGIDPFADERFIKKGNTLLDGILRYQMKDGGFIHSFSYDSDNPTALPDKSNTMAGEQVLYTMAALWRREQNMRTLYDFREEQSTALKKRISVLNDDISNLTETSVNAEVENLLVRYFTIPENERSYVYNYYLLADKAKSLSINTEKISVETKIIESPADDESETNSVTFADKDKQEVDSLPEKLTGEHYVKVTTLLEKLNLSPDFNGKDKYVEKLTAAKNEIASIQNEIDSINEEILDKLYPFESISVKDKKTVDNIVKRYHALSDYDKGKIERYEDVIKTKTKIDNELRAIAITVILLCAVAIALTIVVNRVKNRRNRKQLEMDALANEYADEMSDDS
ncbi:MAG: terpene cyclase/mutase family protein [Faecalibacterium sp.]|nr:terpene cyclase/mutase family protein [Ruminococcus sp.]MCM1392225.1 terpene cyclase/mutase family protein [Ruminococcus sp.]MCM1485922.1 terpene cyclase/mutase family protein [Faecalibacterium sp.]